MKTKFKSLVLFLSVWASCPAQASGPSLELATSDSPIHVGDIFNVELLAKDLFSDAAYSTDLLLAFAGNISISPGNKLSLTSSSYNPYFFDDSALLGMDLAGSAFPALRGADVFGDISLATLQFQALSVGSATIAIETNLLDPNQGLFYLVQGALPINAHLNLEITAVPLPPSALLFASAGIFSLINARKQRS